MHSRSALLERAAICLKIPPTGTPGGIGKGTDIDGGGELVTPPVPCAELPPETGAPANSSAGEYVVLESRATDSACVAESVALPPFVSVEEFAGGSCWSGVDGSDAALVAAPCAPTAVASDDTFAC